MCARSIERLIVLCALGIEGLIVLCALGIEGLIVIVYKKELTSIHKVIVSLEALKILVPVGVESQDECSVHGDELPGKFIDVGATIAAHQRQVQQV